MSSSPPSAGAVQSLVGRQLGKYQIRSEIGQGGMGTVYKAYDATLDRFVALKVLAPQLAWEEEFVQRFVREARAAARLKHPNIVTIYDVGRAGGWYYFAMDYVAGTTLAQIIHQRGAMPAEEVMRVLGPLAAALDHAHSRGLIHRDVKPSNVIVSEAGDVVLTDFGIVRAAQAKGLTRSGTVMGTPEYMAPEQASGDDVDPRTDQYALGIVAYEMLAGSVPFDAESTPRLLYRIVHDAPLPLRTVRPDLPEAASRALSRALAKEKNERYGSCRAFVESLDQSLQAQPADVPARRTPAPAARVAAASTPGRVAVPSQPRPTTRPPTRPGKERQRAVLLGLGGVGLAIVGLLCLGAVVVGILLGPWGPGKENGEPPPIIATTTAPPTVRQQAATLPPSPSPVLPTPEAQPTDTPPSQQGNIVFQDNFADHNSGWEIGDYEAGSVGYEGGAYSVVSLGPTMPMWGVANLFLTDLVIEVDATQVAAGPENNNEYGVGCRIQPDGDGHYLSVSGDGYYSIWLNYGPDWIPLVDWAESDAIQQGNATNHILAVCDGPTLSLFVNGQHLATVEDETFSGGDIALTATSYEDATTKIAFDNLAVYGPTD